MIKRIIDKYRVYDSGLNLLNNKIRNIDSNVDDSMSLQLLLKMFSEQSFLPLTSWSISPKEVLHICNEIVVNKRKCLVEFGAGFSTVCIAQLLKINNIEAKFYSVESDIEWINSLKRILKSNDSEEYVEFLYSPVNNISSKYALKNQEKWYDIESLQRLSYEKNIDLIVVDGPFGGLTPYSRFSAFPFLINNLANNFSIFLDDTNRPNEKEIAMEWKKMSNIESFDYDRYTYLTNKMNFDNTPFSNSK